MKNKIIITQDQMLQVKNLYQQGMGRTKIIRQTGMSEGKVRQIYKILGLGEATRKIKLTDEKLNKISQLHQQGMQAKEIAKIVEIDLSTMGRAVKKLKISFSNKYQPTQDQIEEIKKLAEQNLHMSEIGKIMGVNEKSITRIYKELGFSAPSRKLPDLTNEQNQQVINLFDQGRGINYIAKELNVSLQHIINTFEKLNLNNSGRYIPRTAYLATEKSCKTCQLIKPVDQFRKRTGKRGNIYYETNCQWCEFLIASVKQKKRYKLLRNEPAYKLSSLISTLIWTALRDKDGYRGNEQNFQYYLGYTITQFRQHIQAQFEPWMNWGNYGKYKPSTWKEDDQTTWIWNLDHRNPQSDLPYQTKDDDNFKECWKLDNLRPYSAKQNNIDGGRGFRHKKKEAK